MFKVLRNIFISLVAMLLLFHSLSFDGLKIFADENSSENTVEYVNEEQPVAVENVTEEPVAEETIAAETAVEETAEEQEIAIEAAEEENIQPMEQPAEQTIAEETVVEEATVEETAKEQEIVIEAAEEENILPMEQPAEQPIAEETVIEEAAVEETAAEQETAVEAVSIMPTEYTAEVQEILVKATVAEGTFKEEVELVVEPIYKGTDEYQTAEETLKNEGADFDDMIAFDIYFKVVATGEKIEPDENVKVELSLREEAFADTEAEKIDAETVNVTHITEENEVVKVADTADETAGTVEVTATEEKVEAVEAAFTVESFSTFVLTWKNAEEKEEVATVHFGTLSGTTFTEFAEETIVMDTTATNVSVANSFEGYAHVGTIYCAPDQTIADGVDISDVLYNMTTSWEYLQIGKEGDPDERKTIANGANIYSVYVVPSSENPPTPTGGKVPAPETTKNVTPNPDGSATITLDVLGKIVTEEELHTANVLIILDATQSMGQSGGAKWSNAKAAMQTLIDTLTTGENARFAGKIDFALVTFGRIATVVQNWTKDNAAFRTTCNGINMVSTQGTNWEAGMRGGLYGVLSNYPEGETAAKHDPTYVIFLTDGDPNTWFDRDGGNTQNYNNDDYTRPGYGGNNETSATNAADEVRSITAAENKLYGIFCGTTTSTTDPSYLRLSNIITGEGQGGVKTISANADTIQQEFKAIAEAILNELGANNVTVDDGVTTLSSVSTPVSGSAEGFKYFIKGKTDTDFREWTEHPGTVYSENNGVTWDLGNAGVLVDGTTYRLQFKVWPSQEAYDLIANLNNGTIDYDSLDEDVKSQIIKDGNTYTLKTNTHLNTTYSFKGQTYTDKGDPKSGTMPLVSSVMNVRKDFAHAINDTSPYSKLNFYLTIDGKYYMSDGTLSDTVPTKDSTGYYTVKLPVDESLTGEAFWAPENWTGSVYIAPGFMNGTDVLETGHKYSLYEVITEGDEYEYEFTPQTVRPMVIDGTLTFLVLKDKYNTNEDEADEYTIEGETYYVASTNNGELVGTNRKTAELDITKVIVDNRKNKMSEEEMNKETFTYRVKLTVDKDADISGITAYEYVPRTGEGRFTIFGYQQSDDADIRALDDDVTKFSGKTFGAYTVTTPGGGATLAHVFVEDGDKLTATIDITLKTTEIIRFTNLPSGTEYEIEEVYANLRQADPSRNADAVPSTDVASNLAAQAYTKTTVKTKHGTDTATVEGTKITGKIEDLDTRYYNQFTNETSDFIDVELKGTKKLDGYTWSAGERYYFNLSASDKEPLPGINGRTRFYLTPAESEVGTAAEKTYSFGKIRFTAAGTYKYTVKEDNAGETKDGIVYDVAKEVTIVIKENADKSLTVESVTGTDTVWDAEKLVATTTMTNKTERTEVAVRKEWKGDDDYDVRPESITVKLLADGKPVEGKTAELNEKNEWSYTFTDLPKNNGTQEIKYTVEEVIGVPGYSGKTEGDQKNGYVITNTFTPVKYDPPVKKLVEGEGYDPEETFTFQFKAITEGAPMPEKTEVTIKANEEAEFGWMYLTEPGTYEYEISEVPGKDSQYKYDDTVYKLVFTIGVDEKTNELTCELKVNGEAVDHEAQDAYTFEFTNIFRKNVEVEVQKIWSDSDNAAGTRPEEIEVTLYAGNKAVETVKLNAKNEWKHTFKDLPAVDENDKKIEYTVKEDKVPEGYTMTSAQSNNKVTITNSKTPDTGDMSNVGLWMSLFGASMAGTLGAAYVSLKKKKEEE